MHHRQLVTVHCLLAELAAEGYPGGRIYIGAGQFIHSPHPGDVVKISSLYAGWYAATYVGARRIL